MARKAFIFLVLIATFSSTLSSCVRGFIVKADGRYGDAIYFRFYELGEATPAMCNITELIVQRRTGDHQWETVWALSGKRLMNEVEYGKNYEGLNETTRALPLSLQGAYRVHVTDTSLFDPPGYGYAQFIFNDTGEIVMLK